MSSFFFLMFSPPTSTTLDEERLTGDFRAVTRTSFRELICIRHAYARVRTLRTVDIIQRYSFLPRGAERHETESTISIA